jgi:hypothetical protein
MRKLENDIKALTLRYSAAAQKILDELPTFSRREFRREPRIDLYPPEALGSAKKAFARLDHLGRERRLSYSRCAVAARMFHEDPTRTRL